MFYSLLRPALFRLDPERAHTFALRALRLRPPGPRAPAGRLATNVAGLSFPNPVGMAAGFDKDALVPDELLGLGFGFAEVGSITPLPQSGNPQPRLFRLTRDRAVINRMGFNNGGAEVAAARLRARAALAGAGTGSRTNTRANNRGGGIVGVNIGANKDSPDRIADYAHMAGLMAPLASYLAVNISSPNTPGLRALQDEGALVGLLDAVIAARDEGTADASRPSTFLPPIFLKVAPDLAPADVDAIARIAMDKRLGALIIANTTLSRDGLSGPHRGESGGMSGAPLRQMALDRLRDFRAATGGTLPLVGVGGIGSAEDAWERIRAGASLVQIYSAMVYEGPGIARRIVSGIERLMKRDGFDTIEAAVGSE